MKNKLKIIIPALIVIIILGIITAEMLYNKMEGNKGTQAIVGSNKLEEEIIPNVTESNTRFEISTQEETTDPVIINVTEKENDYDLYYSIEPIISEETENSESIQVQTISTQNYIKYESQIEIAMNANIKFVYEKDEKYSATEYIITIENIIESIDDQAPESEEVSEEELAKAKVTQVENKMPYYIIVDYSANVVTIYTKDDEGNYTKPVKAMVCSTGKATPRSGVYKLPGRRSKWGALFGNVWGQYTTAIVGNILFHSVPYTARDNSTLEYWEYDKLGTTASAGCIRLQVSDAMWIYSNCASGTQVEFTSGASNPLGKPSARKISSYENLRGFDPTDPASNNPWRNANINNNETKETSKQDETTPATSQEPTTTSKTSPEASPETTTEPEPTESEEPSNEPTQEPSEEPTPSQEPSPTPISDENENAEKE